MSKREDRAIAEAIADEVFGASEATPDVAVEPIAETPVPVIFRDFHGRDHEATATRIALEGSGERADVVIGTRKPMRIERADVPRPFTWRHA